MKRILLFCSLGLMISACQRATSPSPSKGRWVEDIHHRPDIDKQDFHLCGGEEGVMQYFNNSRGMEYHGGKPALEKAFHQHYSAEKMPPFSGLIRLRFIVNCQGQTDRFRLLAMNPGYEEVDCPDEIAEQVLQIAKGLKGWIPMEIGGEQKDYYQYLILKFEKGGIKEILP